VADDSAEGLDGDHWDTVVIEQLETSGAHRGEDRGARRPSAVEPDVHAGVEPAGRVTDRLHLELGTDALVAELDDDRADVATDVEQRRAAWSGVVVVNVAHAAGTE
jgi:hypothetical protein